MTLEPQDVSHIHAALLPWSEQHRRVLPLRGDRTPYRVLVAEVMSQQTQAEAVGPYLDRFLARFPTPRALAAAPEQDVLTVWRGLGYYRRAIHLWHAARQIVERHGGEVPAGLVDLRALPGVGPYVAGAIASLAFGSDEPAVDANATRVLARLFDVRLPVDTPAGVRTIAALARAVLPPGSAGRWNEALMDFGALVCVPRRPRCALCPLSAHCRGLQAATAYRLPLRAPRRSPAEVTVVTVLAWNRSRQVAVRQRPAGGLLGRMWEFPTLEGAVSVNALAAYFGWKLQGVRALPVFRHVFTHRIWLVHPHEVHVDLEPSAVAPLDAAALPNAVPHPTAVAAERRTAEALATRPTRSRVAAVAPPVGDLARPPGTIQWVTLEALGRLPLAGPALRVAAGAGLRLEK